MMKSRAKIAGHAIHPILVVFPLGLLTTAVVFDIIYLSTGTPRWADVSFWMIASGVIGGLCAAVFGWIDWFAIPAGTRAKSLGLTHGLGNVVVVSLFAASWLMRYFADPMRPSVAACVVGFCGIVVAVFTGWMGGELVERLGVGIEPGAHLNAPSSLTTELPGDERRAA